jgi:hypothetical protein
MNIETKYNIGDEVWGIPNGEPMQITIARIYVKVHRNFIRISYEFDNTEDRTYRLPESAVFPTKEELLKSL